MSDSVNVDSPSEAVQPSFSVRVVHSGDDPLGRDIGLGHAFWTLTTHVSGSLPADLEVGQTCIRQASTADGRMVVPKAGGGNRTEWVRYQVGRVS